jgi:CRP/FNR family transcriptional regulator, anaerobic regulatory protein
MELSNSISMKTTSKMYEKLSEIGFSKIFKEGEVIINDHSYIKSIPIVITGSIKVMRTDDDGREILLYYITSGESCIMSFLGGLHQDTSKIKAIAEENTEILFIPTEKLSELMREYPEWLDYMFRLYHKRFEELLDVVNEIAFKKMDERLLNYLENKAALSKSNIISITHEQMANELGTARVVISRLLKQLETEGVVELGRNKITLL